MKLMSHPQNVIPLGHAPKRSNRTSATRATPKQRRSFGKIRKLPSGRFQASYVVDGVRHLAPVTFDTKGDAGGWLDLRHAELLEHRWKPPAPATPEITTLGDYADRWLESRRNRHGQALKPRTKALYRGLLDGHILPAFGAYGLREITPEMVDDWHDQLLPHAPTRRAHAYVLLSSIMKSAATARRPLVDVNPCQVEHASKVDRVSESVPATPAEVFTITQAMPERLRAAVLIAAWGGLRFGELTELRRSDVLLDGNKVAVRVSRGVTWLRGEGPVVGSPKSTAGRRTVHLPPSLRDDIARHLDEHTGPAPDALLFPSAGGGHLNPSTLMKPYRRAREAAGRPDLRWHDLRHTAGTTAAKAGATLRENMARMGHSTIAASLVYQHAAAERDEEIAANLDVLIRRGRKAARKTAKK